jgi:hypothetical protein
MALEAACSLAASWVQEADYNEGEGENVSTGGRYSIFKCLTGGFHSNHLREERKVVLISNPLHEGDIAALKATCLRNI